MYRRTSIYVKALRIPGVVLLVLWVLGATGAVGWSATRNWTDFLAGIALLALSAA